MAVSPVAMIAAQVVAGDSADGMFLEEVFSSAFKKLAPRLAWKGQATRISLHAAAGVKRRRISWWVESTPPSHFSMPNIFTISQPASRAFISAVMESRV